MHPEFIHKLKIEFNKPLPGVLAQNKLKPYLKINKNLPSPPPILPKLSAVMALIYPIKKEPHLLLIERTTYDGVHSGQLGFPGGKIEKTDTNSLFAALRETTEEVGIIHDEIEVIGQLSEVYVLASNFLVYPYVGIMKKRPDFLLDEKEVAAILEIPIKTFYNNAILKEKPIKSNLGFTLMAPYYDIDGKVLWGATAMMISELTHVVKETGYY
jgi:8-oxo-dGTP pyrophosphatase MutT (NUDIX family)